MTLCVFQNRNYNDAEPWTLDITMLDSYRPILFYIAQLIAWWTVADYSTPKMTSVKAEIGLFALGSVWLVFCAYRYFKNKQRYVPIFLGALALLPWCFYGELLFLGVSPQTLEGAMNAAALTHVIVVYNLFRYFLLVVVLLISLKSLLNALRDFS